MKKGTKHTEETKTKMRAAAKLRCQDPEHRKEMSERFKRTWQNPKLRRKTSEAKRRQWANPESVYNTPKYQKKRAIAISASRQGIPVSEWGSNLTDDPNYFRCWRLKDAGLPDEWVKMALAQKQNRTDIELLIEYWLIGHNISYEFQKYISLPSARTWIDFFIEPNICVYCDGDYWHKSEKIKKRDARIMQELESMDYVILRLTGIEIHDGIRPWKILGLSQPEFKQKTLEETLCQK